MEVKREAHQALVTHVLQGEGSTARAERHAAFDNAVVDEPLHALIAKVAEQPTRITDDDFASVKSSGLSEDQIFELVVCAAVGQATRQYQSAVEALSTATDEDR